MAPSGKQLFDDLLAIEVDVVVCQHLPEIPKDVAGKEESFFVADVTATYRDFLDENLPPLLDRWEAWVASGEADQVARDVPRLFEPLIRDGSPVNGLEPAASADELERVRHDAELAEALARALAAGGELPDPGVIQIFRRIRGTVDQLATTSGPARVRVARKAWELGTETIVAQTVVQVDGDIVQRVDGSRHSRLVRDLHRDAVGGAIAHWHVLVDLFVTVVAGTAGLVRSILGGPAARRSWLSRRQQLRHLSGTELRTLVSPRALRATVGHFVAMMHALVGRGGVSIGTSGEEAYARTVIQPDGDSVWLITTAALDRPDELAAHARAVADWYERARRVAATVERYASAISAAVAGFVGGLSLVLAVIRDSWLPLLVGVVATIALPWCLRRLFRWYIGRKISGIFA